MLFPSPPLPSPSLLLLCFVFGSQYTQLIRPSPSAPHLDSPHLIVWLDMCCAFFMCVGVRVRSGLAFFVLSCRGCPAPAGRGGATLASRRSVGSPPMGSWLPSDLCPILPSPFMREYPATPHSASFLRSSLVSLTSHLAAVFVLGKLYVLCIEAFFFGWFRVAFDFGFGFGRNSRDCGTCESRTCHTYMHSGWGGGNFDGERTWFHGLIPAPRPTSFTFVASPKRTPHEAGFVKSWRERHPY